MVRLFLWSLPQPSLFHSSTPIRPGCIVGSHFAVCVNCHRNLLYKAMTKGGKIGRKQPVLKKSSQKKKSKFKGVQKQKKLSVELARNTATEITFVGKDDVVSEQIPPPAASASLRKIAAD